MNCGLRGKSAYNPVRPRLRRSALPLLVLICVSGLIAREAWLSASATAEFSSAYVGQPLTVRIQVTGNVTPDLPDTSVVNDFAVQYIGKERYASGRSTGFIYSFRAKRPGNLRVPPIPVSGGGVRTKTASLTVWVRPVTETEVTLTVELSPAEAWVGQHVSGHFELRYRGHGTGYEVEAPFLHDRRLVTLLPTRGFVRLPPEGHDRAQVNRTLVLASITKKGSEASPSNTVRVPFVLIPQEAGTISLTGIGMDLRIIRPNRQNIESLFISAETRDLVVRDLPERGRPADFSGIVGRYKLESTADVDSVRVGDPINLTLSLSGDPIPASAKLPDVEAVLGEEFQVRPGAPAATSPDGVETFHFILSPLNVDSREIPSVSHNYFDPEAGRYVSARTKALPLRVGANRVLEASDAEGAGEDERVSVVPVDWLPGIAHNFDGPEVLTREGLGLAALFASPFRTAAIAIPPLAYLMLVLAGWVSRWRKAPDERVLTAWEEFERSPLQDARALRRYLAGVAGLAADSATFEDFRKSESLRGIGPETMESLRDTLQTEEARKFGGSAPRKLPDIRAVAERIHKELGLGEKFGREGFILAPEPTRHPSTTRIP